MSIVTDPGLEMEQQVVRERRHEHGGKRIPGGDRNDGGAETRPQVTDKPEGEQQRRRERESDHGCELRRDRQLKREQRPEPPGEPASTQLSPQVLQDDERDEREEEDCAQVEVPRADLTKVRGRESEQIPADEGRPSRACQVAAEEVPGPRRQGREQYPGHVVRHDRAREHRERRRRRARGPGAEGVHAMLTPTGA